MKIELLIYIYTAVCSVMILFNCAMLLLNAWEARRLEDPNRRLNEALYNQLQRLQKGETLSSAYLQKLSKQLKRIGTLRRFSADLELAEKTEAKAVHAYLDQVRPCILGLSDHYCSGDSLSAAYYVYVLERYQLVFPSDSELLQKLKALLSSPNIYLRENVLRIFYRIGDAELLVSALLLLDQQEYFHHPKLIHDGMLLFAGDREALVRAIFRNYDRFSVRMQTTLVNYLRLSGGGCDAEIFSVMTKPGQDDELCFACMRYFGRYPYRYAGTFLQDCLRDPSAKRWEYAAIAATALSAYPGTETTSLLKKALSSPVWYIRANAAESLEKLGLGYADLAEIFEGEDRFAREILQYRLDCRDARIRGGGET